ncbi:integral membrane protein, putative [Talaromyces stipitatus ATCC 10500]|uniref:Integral membrane protein, putative n=1 Tax=Talaromyces stipitatus (strain ATCC 10500 / CBS 375.48 / QM 6759 / NRRL 1006) TaxID=441959 RepID=B8MJ62_TALSN|nr:integral membrane protein, putative [Talaromyces stipitatus ATCC 10500]EED14651.1 integral membrane protein, putative [Talaromyces stipitatus ATCC 10500]
MADDRSLVVKAVPAVFCSIAFLTVVLRCYVRLSVVKAFGLDDGAMVISMMCYIMFCGCMIGGALYGTGRRFVDLTADQRMTAMEYWWLCEIAYCFSSVFCKISICFFLLRITIRKSHIYLLYCVMILTVIGGFIFMFMMLLQCKPVSFFWARTTLDPVYQGHCISIDIIITMTYVYSALAAFCDFTVGILPIFLVGKLNMRHEAKLAVIGILSMACVASLAVIIRIPFVKTFRDPDFLYATVDIAIWSCIENGLGISAASLATLRPLLRKFRGSYNSRPESSSRMISGPNSKPRRLWNNSLPLGSIDRLPERNDLRPDKTAVILTTIRSDPRENNNLNQSRSSGEREFPVLDIHQTFEAMTTSTSALDDERVPREHV